MARALKRTGLIGAIAAAAVVSHGSADTIFNTGEPGGPFGFIGYDVSQAQSIGVSFTPTQTYLLDDIGVWMMSNDFDAPGRSYTLSLRPNATPGAPTTPSSSVIESWTISTTAVGWNPVLEVVHSQLRPRLDSGVAYWIVAISNEPAGMSPVWVWGNDWNPVYSASNDHQSGQGWQGGYTQGSAPGTLVHATPVPAPSALLAGLGGVIFVAGRRQRPARH